MKSPFHWFYPCAAALILAITARTASADLLVDDMYIVTPPEASKDAAFLQKAVLWEDGVLPLTFADGFTDSQKQQVLGACAVWSSVANVRCVEGEYKGRTVQVGHWLPACWALWGM